MEYSPLNARQCRTRAFGAPVAALTLLPLLLPANTVVAGVTQTPASQDVGVIFNAQKQAPASLFPRKRDKVQLRASIPPVSTDNESIRLSVGGFRFEGDAAIDQQALQRMLQPWQGRDLSFAEFEQAVHQVADYLRSNGHPYAEVSMNRALLGEGTVAIAVQGLTPKPEPVVPQVLVTGFSFEGLTLASAEEMQSVLKAQLGQPLSLPQLEAAAQQAAAHLRAKGYPLVQAYLPPQRIQDGVVRIALQEGALDGASGSKGIVVRSNASPVKDSTVAALLAEGAPAGKPIQAAALERALLVAGEVPGIKKVQAELTPGSVAGTTKVEADVESAGLVAGAVWADNYGNRHAGVNRLNALLNLNSPLGYGEQLSVNATKSDSLESGKVAIQLPLGNRGAKVGVSASSMNVDMGITTDVPRNLSGDTKVVSLFGSLPMTRSATVNTTLTASLDQKDLKNSLSTLALDDRKITMLSLGVNGDRYDSWGGRLGWSVVLASGDNDLSGDLGYAALDAASARTSGSFQKLNVALSRLSRLDKAGDYQLALSLSAQLASKNLDNSEKLQLGGPSGVRAYPMGEGLGDDGWLASAEVRTALGKFAGGDVTLFGFVDAGGVKQYKHTWNGALLPGKPNQYTLAGAGAGLRLSYDDKGGVSITVANKLGNNPNQSANNTDADGRNRAARVWVIGNIAF